MEKCNDHIIWVSEIILQQTRIDQELNYLKFTEKFPPLKKLADSTLMN